MSNKFDEGKKAPESRRNSAIHQEESIRWAREHESQTKGTDSRSRGRNTGKEKEKKEKPKGSKTRRRVITMIIAECFALLFIFGYGFFARKWNMIQRVDDWEPEAVQNQNFSVDLPQYEKQKGHWGIYIFGVDSRGSNVAKGTNADVNMICDINHDTGEIRLVSVFRDTYLNIDDDNNYNKINHSYFVGGPREAAKALNKNLDLNITDFATFNWKAVADGINILGGIDMEISKAEFYYINSFITETVEATGVYSTHLKKAGMNHLDGVQAVAYGRLRLMDTDYARTERQRKVIQAALEKAKAADWATLNQLAEVLFPQVATSLYLPDILSLLTDVGKYHIGETGGFPFARGEANMGRKGACVIPQTLEGNVIELHEFLYGEENYTPSNTVKNISAKISSDTGMYKQGVSIDHVSTTGGVIPTQAPKTTAAPKEDEEKETKDDSGTKEDGETKESKEGDETKESGETDKNKDKDKEDGEDSTKESDGDKESSDETGRAPGEDSDISRHPTAEPKPSDEEGSSSRESSTAKESGTSRETDGTQNGRETESDKSTEGSSHGSRPTSPGDRPQESTAERKPEESSPVRETTEEDSGPSPSAPTISRPTSQEPTSQAPSSQGPSPSSPAQGNGEVITVPEAPVISYDGPPGAGQQ